MAKYWTNLNRREDVVERRDLTKADIDFLLDLQTELNTQDTACTANPRYWVIKDDRFVDCQEESMDTFQVFDSEQADFVATGVEEFYYYLQELIEEDVIDVDYKLVLTEGVRNEQIELHSDEGIEDTLECIEDFKNFAETIDGISHLQFIPSREESFIHDNVMFLTQIDAENHLRANYYHYGKNARTFCMVSWRSPRYEQLLKMLSEVDFGKMLKDYNL